MRIRKKHRLFGVVAMLAICTLGIYIILRNLNDNIVFFYPPSEISTIHLTKNKVRVGGIVKNNSIVKISEKTISFAITDHIADLQIEYSGALPALFREEQGIVAEGKLDKNNIFQATKLLTKHDENYQPPELKNIKDTQ